MSKFNLIALAIAASLASPAALALEVTPNADQLRVANVDVASATTAVAIGELEIAIADEDLIIGRTVGFSVRIDLQDGAVFDANVIDPARGSALGAGATQWTVSRAAGGSTGDNYVVYSVQPVAGSVGVVNGEALTFNANAIVLKNVAALGTAGASVSAKVTFADPGTAAIILQPVTEQIVTSVNPLVYTVTPVHAYKVDVGTKPGVASKTRFSNATGVIGSAQSSDRSFSAGELTIGLLANGVLADGAARQRANASATFAWQAADTVTLSVTGKLAAFKNVATPAPGNSANVLLTAANLCTSTGVGANPTTTTITNGVGAVTATGATFGAVAYSGGPTALASGSAELCLVAPTGNVVIDASDLDTSVVVKRASTGKTVSASAAASALKYNGPVVEVDHFNPSSNQSQVSYLRIINPSNVSGLVSISGVCDNGTPQAPVSLTLGGGKAVLLTAADLATGAKGLSGSLTQCTDGKSRLTVTGEFNGMKVQNFLRNWTNDGSQINTNVNNQN